MKGNYMEENNNINNSNNNSDNNNDDYEKYAISAIEVKV